MNRQFPKLEKIAKYYDSTPVQLFTKLYVDDSLSGPVIAKKISYETGITISSRSIEHFLGYLGIMRTKSQARMLAIKTGRMDYSKLRKPMKSAELRKGISVKVRYAIMYRDNFRCKLCGRNSSEAILVIDHILPVVAGGDNSEANLRTLCRECNHGKMMYEREK